MANTYKPPTVKQIMRWRVTPAAKVTAYFIRLHRDENGWAHIPVKQLRKEVGDVSSEAVDKALDELKGRGALQANPDLKVKLTGKQRRKGRAYRLHRPSSSVYKERRVSHRQPPKKSKKLSEWEDVVGA
jgi:hypothetical protein